MPKAVFKLSLLSTALLLASQNLWAEELEAITVEAGSMYRMGEVPIYQAKSAVSLSRDQLDQQNITKADEIGRYQAGFENQVFGEDTNTNWFRVRGAEVTQAIDGLPMASYGFFTPYVNTFGLEAVEITKGADAMTFGAANSGGLINYVSKRPHKEQIRQGELKVNAGNHHQYGLGVDYTNRIAGNDNLRYRVVASYQGKNGQWDGTKNKTVYLAPSFEWDISDRTHLTLLASYQFDKGVPSSNFLPQEGTLVPFPNGSKIGRSTNLGDPVNDREYNRQYNIGYEFSHQFTDGLTFNSSYRYSYNNNFHRGSYVYSYPFYVNGIPTVAQDTVFNNGTSIAHTLDNHLTWKYSNSWLKNTLVVGYDYRQSKIKAYYRLYDFSNTSNIDLFNPTSGYNQTRSINAPYTSITARQLGVYLQNQSRFVDKFVLNLGVRRDWAKQEAEVEQSSIHNKDNIHHTSYSASFMYEAPYGLNPYLSYSEAFNLPLGLDKYKRLYEPKITRQYEIGVKYLPTWLDGSITLAAFKTKDQGELISEGVGTTVNSEDPIYRKGIELQADVNLTANWNATLAYTYLKSIKRTSTGDERNPLLPKHSLALKTDYTFANALLNGLSLGAGVRYIGKSVTQNGSLYSGASVPSATVVDLMARYQFTPSWFVQLNVENVGNRRYLAGCDYYCYYGAERNINASVSYKF